jgi:hypothetical protein
MKSITRTVAIAILAGAPASALGQSVPFAEPPSLTGQLDILPGLGDIMIDVQLRHIKLGYAGRAGNWDLVKYELDRIAESLRKAAILYRNIPIEYVAAMNKPLVDMRDGVAAKDLAKFNNGYLGFTSACNSCHAAGGVGFIRIQSPTSSPFSDEVHSVGKQ